MTSFQPDDILKTIKKKKGQLQRLALVLPGDIEIEQIEAVAKVGPLIQELTLCADLIGMDLPWSQNGTTYCSAFKQFPRLRRLALNIDASGVAQAQGDTSPTESAPDGMKSESGREQARLDFAHNLADACPTVRHIVFLPTSRGKSMYLARHEQEGVSVNLAAEGSTPAYFFWQ